MSAEESLAARALERYLAHAATAGCLCVDDPPDAYRVLHGLAVRDTQIRVLLGEAPPSNAQIAVDARSAVDGFLRLHGAPGR